MTEEEHKKKGHIKDSCGSWIDPKDYMDCLMANW